jgi:hypothetical protein
MLTIAPNRNLAVSTTILERLGTSSLHLNKIGEDPDSTPDDGT